MVAQELTKQQRKNEVEAAIKAQKEAKEARQDEDMYGEEQEEEKVP